MARQDTTPDSGPVRTCIGCRRRASKRELVRVTAGSVDGQPAVVPDPTGILPGRGAHLHPTRRCYDLAARRKAFTRALRLERGLSTAPVAAHLDSRTVSPSTSGTAGADVPPDQDWSNSS